MDYLKINCINNNQGAWCNDKRIKRSLFGIGARCCLVFQGKQCEYQHKFPFPKLDPPSGIRKS